LNNHLSLSVALLLAATVVACSPSGRAGDAAARRSNPTPTAAPAPKTTAPARPAAAPPTRGWTAFRGDQARTGRSQLRGPRTARLKWVFRTAGRIWADAAVTGDGTVYVASHDGRLYAVGPDGRELWSYDTGGKIWTSPVIGKDGSIYIGSDNDRLIAIDR
jgi:hypothetical protein